MALDYAGVEGFYSHFVTLTEEDIEGLTIPPRYGPGAHEPIPTVLKRLLTILSAYYQELSREYGFSMNMTSVPKAQFDTYRTGEYNSDQKITSWKKKLPEQTDALLAWNKHMRPN